jgi:uncharacterized protein (TIRG00374 family)
MDRIKAIKIKIDRFLGSFSKNQRNLFFYSLTLLVCLLLLEKVGAHLEILSKLTIWYFLLLFAFDIIFLVIHSLQHYHVFSLFKNRLSMKNVAAITSISCLYNQLLPYQGSSFVKGALVRKKLEISWTDVIVAIGGFYLFSNIALGLIILFGSGIVFWDLELNKYLYLFFIGFLIVILALIFFVNWSKNRTDLIVKFPILGLLIKVLQRFDVYQLDYKKNIEVMLLQIFKLLVVSLKLYSIFIIFGVDVSFLKVFLVQSIITVSLPVTLTPGNLGIKEGILVLFSGFLGASSDVVLMAAIMNRIMSITTFTFAGSISHLYLSENPIISAKSYLKAHEILNSKLGRKSNK